MGKKFSYGSFGFTLLELMVVVAIIGVLAAVGIPMLQKYILKSKTSEAYFSLRKIYDGEVAYYQEERVDQAGNALSRSFVFGECQPYPVPGVSRASGNFSSSGWPQIRFSTESPGYYLYVVESEDSPSNPCSGAWQPPGYGWDPPSNVVNGFLARAFGDLDGDGQVSQFARWGLVYSGSDEVNGMGGVFTLDELE